MRYQRDAIFLSPLLTPLIDIDCCRFSTMMPIRADVNVTTRLFSSHFFDADVTTPAAI